MNVLIDSYGWIEYFTGGPLASKYAKYIETANSSDYISPSIVIFEVYKRIKMIKGETAALKAIPYIIEHTKIIPIDKKEALNSAEASIRLKLAMADSIIKSIADENNATVVTSDKHFKNMENVIFIE